MSIAWAFYTVSGPKFESFFAGPHPDKFQQLMAALTWDEGIDEEIAEFAAKHIADRGLDYSGLDEAQARLLDECLSVLTSDEGLADELERKPESPDFVRPSVIESLLCAAQKAKLAVSLLPTLQSGRRYGGAAPTPNCSYCLLTHDEAGQLSAELSAILSATNDWGKESWMPELVKECLIRPLNEAVKTSRPLLGRLG